MQRLELQWPSAQTELTDVVQRLLDAATEVHFVEIGLDGHDGRGVNGAGDAARDIEKTLADAMETEDDGEREAIGRRLAGFLRSLRDEGLMLTASVAARTVEGVVGVGRLDVLSIVVDRQVARRERATTDD